MLSRYCLVVYVGHNKPKFTNRVHWCTVRFKPCRLICLFCTPGAAVTNHQLSFRCQNFTVQFHLLFPYVPSASLGLVRGNCEVCAVPHCVNLTSTTLALKFMPCSWQCQSLFIWKFLGCLATVTVYPRAASAARHAIWYNVPKRIVIHVAITRIALHIDLNPVWFTAVKFWHSALRCQFLTARNICEMKTHAPARNWHLQKCLKFTPGYACAI